MVALNLKDALTRWRTYTPALFNDTDDKWTVQYKYVSRGDLQAVNAMTEEEVEQELDTNHAFIKELFPDEWKLLPLVTKRRVLLVAQHTGPVDNLTDGDKKIANVFEIFAIVNNHQMLLLLSEIMQALVGANEEDKKNSGR